MKRLLLIIALVTPCQGVEAPPKYLNAWGGLDTFHDSAQIRDTDASALSNVLTDRGFLEKRTGSELFQTLLAGWSVLYMQEFVASSKTRYLIAHASSTVYASDTATAFAAISTTTLGYNVDCVSAYGKEYCADGFATPWGWNGTAVTRLSSAPICTFLEFADERLYCANTTAGDSRVHAGAYGDPADWTVPALDPLPADVPNMWTFNRTDGEGITCFKVTPWGKFIGKRHSTHILKGQDNVTYYKRLIDPGIGCVDDRSVQMVDGVLMWLALEGVYAWAGSGKPELISQDIDAEIKAARQLVSNKASWTQTSQADWQLGVLNVSGPGALVSETITPGSITPSSWTVVDTSSSDFIAGQVLDSTSFYYMYISTASGRGDVVLRTADNMGAEISDTGGWGVLYPTRLTDSTMWGSYLWSDTRSGACSDYASNYARIYYGDTSSSYTQILTHPVDGTDSFLNFDLSASTVTYVTFLIRVQGTGTSATYTSNLFVKPSVFTFHFKSNTSGGTCVFKWDVDSSSNSNNGIYVSSIFDTVLSTPIAGPLSSNIVLSPGTSVYFDVHTSTTNNNTAWTDWRASTNSVIIEKRYWQYRAKFSSSDSAYTAILNDVTLLARTTAEYYSDVKYISASTITWLTFDSNESADGGSLSYWTRTSTGAFTKSSSTPTWVAQTNHLQVAANASAYYQWKTLFNVPSGSNAVTINDVTTNWQEGSAAPVASLVWDHRYHLCVMNSSTTVLNDRCWVYQRNKRWTHFDGPNYSALTLFNNEPLAGSAGTDGAIDKIMRPGIYSDKGVAIDAYWETPNYTWEQPNHHKTLRNLWFDAEYNSGGTLDVGYALNRGTVFTSTSTTLDSTSGYVAKRVENLVDGYAKGRYIRLRFGNDILDKYFRLNTVTIYGEVDPLISD